MSKKDSSKSTGISLCSILFVVFLALKLAGVGQVATWSWWWVTAPLWMPAALMLGVVAVIWTCVGLLKAMD